MNQPPSPGLTLLSASTIVDSLYPHLSVGDVLNISRLCRATWQAVNAWFPSAYNINKHLEPFFGDLETTLKFRSIQAATETLISGSQALQFFDRSHYEGSDLDIYTPCRHTKVVGTFILSIGYVFQPTQRQLASPQGNNSLRHLEEVSSRRASVRVGDFSSTDPYDWAFMEDVFTFTKTRAGDGSESKIQIIVVDPESTPLACILNFHSTLVMNFITHDRAYSLFPRTTLLDRIAITLGKSSDLQSVKRAYSKYISRDFRISVAPVPPIDSSSPLNLGIRWIGDSQTWTIGLNTTGVLIPETVKRSYEIFGRPPIMNNGFTLGNHLVRWSATVNPAKHRYVEGNYLLSFEYIRSFILRYPLVLPVYTPDGYSSYPTASRFIWLQRNFEVDKYEHGQHRPETLPESQCWDAEILRLIQQDIKTSTAQNQN